MDRDEIARTCHELNQLLQEAADAKAREREATKIAEETAEASADAFGARMDAEDRLAAYVREQVDAKSNARETAQPSPN